MRASLKQQEKQAIYCKRKWVAEQVFGRIKGGLGFRYLTLRGQDLARAQWLFVCAVHKGGEAGYFTERERDGFHNQLY